jgi:hypothetical protein
VAPLKAYVELLVKGGRRAVIDIASIKAIFTAQDIDCFAIAPPESCHTMLLSDGTEFDFYGISVDRLLGQLKMHQRIDGWLPHP